MIVWEAKAPGDVRPYGIDWSPMLGPDDSIASASITLVQGAIIDSQSNDGNTTIATISGGTACRPATFTAVMTTADGRVFNECITLPILNCVEWMPSSATKRTLFLMAMEDCGLPGYEFEATAEEIASGIRRMDALMQQIQPATRLPYNFPTAIGNSDPDDPSWVPDYALAGIAGRLARSIAPGLGKTLTPDQKRNASEAWSVIAAKTINVPEIRLPRSTPRGAGNQHWNVWYPFILPATCCGDTWPRSAS